MKVKMPLVLLGVVIIAAGIYMYTRPSEPAVQVPGGNTSSTVPSATVPASPAGNASPSTTSALPVIDGTWNTYTSASLGFTFQWPTKGRNAPTWEVTSGDKDCVGRENVDEHVSTTFVANGISFCHTSFNEGAAGSMYLTDAYTTKIGSRYVTITFVKRVTSAGALDCPFMAEHPYSTSGSSCIPFEEDVYKAHLDQIMSTFQLTTKA